MSAGNTPKSTSQKAVGYLQNASQQLKSIFEKVSAIKKVQQKVLSHLDTNTVKQCQVANIVGSKLVLIFTNGSLATQVRYQARDILAKFAQDPALQHIKYIECKVRQTNPPVIKKTAPTRQVEHLSPDTSAIIHELADTIEDPKIREIMHRIANHKKDQTTE